MTGAVKFPRLNHMNYPEWSMQMEAVLVRADYWELITGDEALVEGETDQTKVKAFRKRQAACKAEIILRVNDSQLTHMNSNDPKVIWDSLAKVHCARGFGSQLQLRRHFITSTMDEGQTMESWIGEVHACARHLENVDIKVSDEDMIVVLTAGLPDSYTPIIITFDALNPKKLTLDFVINRLLNEEA
jgi:gag-polypeptide of LTR copia-type